MPKNSFDNSLAKYSQVEKIVSMYACKGKYERSFEVDKNEKLFKKILAINKCERALRALSDPYRTIIKNTFLIKKDTYWWVDFYPKTTYYRLRTRAINSFLRVYNLQ